MKLFLVALGFALCLISLCGSAAGAYPPYHAISDMAGAQAEARERKLPLAYLGAYADSLTRPCEKGDPDELTQMALAALQGQAVVIFFDGTNMAPVPGIIHEQFHINDDGPLPGGASWKVPKIVFCDPAISKILGRVSAKQMSDGREASINSTLRSIQKIPDALTPAATSSPAAVDQITKVPHNP